MKSTVEVGELSLPSVSSARMFDRAVYRYGLAVIAVAIALAIKLALAHFNLQYPLTTSFLAAIAIAFWYGGTGPGILAVVLSSAAFGYFVVPLELKNQALDPGSTAPASSSRGLRTEVSYSLYFILVAVLMSWFSVSRRRAERLLSRARSELEVKVKERTARLTRLNDDLLAEIAERTTAEEQLRQTEERLRNVINNAPVALFAVDRSGVITLSEGRGLEAVDLKPEQVAGKSVFDLYPDSSVLNFNARRALAGESVSFVTDAGNQSLEVHFVPVSARHGEVAGFTGIAYNITDRRRTERELRLVIDTIPAQAWSALADGMIDYCSKSWLDYTGMSLEAVRDRGWGQAFHPEDLATHMEKWRLAIETAELFENEARIRGGDGVYRWFLIQGVPLRNQAGGVVRWYGTCVDISERKRSEEALRASEQVARGQVEALTFSLDVLATAPEPEKFMGKMLGTICRLLNAQSVFFLLLNEATDSLVLRAWAEGENSSGIMDFAKLEPEHPLSKDPLSWKMLPMMQELLFTQGPVICEDVQTDPRIDFAGREYYKQKGIKKILIVPVLAGGEVKGIVSLRHGARMPYRPEEVELAQALAHQVMLATQLTELAEQSRKAAILAERNRMARDIHDTLAQGFTGVIVQLEAAADAITCGERQEGERYVHRASELARLSLNEARRSVHALRPDALSHANFWDALKGIIKNTTAGSPIRTSTRLRGSLPVLSPEWQENLMHIGQEALTNTLKYAHAAKFETRLNCNGKELRLEFEDDGDGFNLTDGHDGFGLAGMRERAEQMGGNLVVFSSRGQGTKIRVTLPYAKEPVS